MTPTPVALFVTCLVDQIMPEVGLATVRLLRRADCEVLFPPGQTCCGQPFFNSGFLHEATRLAKQTIELLESYEVVVLPSGSCTGMIRVEYAHLLAEEPEWAARAQALAAKTFELTEFLTQTALKAQTAVLPAAAGAAGEDGEETAVTYHDSCHMCRLLGLRQSPRQLLRQNGYQISEMSESDRCCGFGGLFSERLSNVAGAMSAEKLRQAQATGADKVVTADPGCLMQLRRVAAAQNWQIAVVHIATLLARD